MKVLETFLSVNVADMKRACAFYEKALGAEVAYATAQWTSIRIAGVRVGLALDAAHVPGRTGLHFAVRDLAAACVDIERAGGRVIAAEVTVAPGVVLADVEDSEGNGFALTRAAA